MSTRSRFIQVIGAFHLYSSPVEWYFTIQVIAECGQKEFWRIKVLFLRLFTIVAASITLHDVLSAWAY